MNPPDIFSSIFFPECTELSANRVFISFCTIVQYLRVYFGQVSRSTEKRNVRFGVTMDVMRTRYVKRMEKCSVASSEVSGHFARSNSNYSSFLANTSRSTRTMILLFHLTSGREIKIKHVDLILSSFLPA